MGDTIDLAELEAIRRQLDRLAERRLQRSLTEPERSEWQALVERENALLDIVDHRRQLGDVRVRMDDLVDIRRQRPFTDEEQDAWRRAVGDARRLGDQLDGGSKPAGSDRPLERS